jgi:peptidoglycan LD-endopeptidase CwlK
MRKWSQRSLGNLAGVHPDLRRVMDAAVQSSPVDFIVIEGLRTRERQAELVRQGASRTMNSRHLTGHAVDLLPIDPADGRGKFDWPLYHRLAPAVKTAADRLGVSITWGGDWTRFRDGPHFELSWHDYPAGQPFPKAAMPPDVEPPQPPASPPLSPWSAFWAALRHSFGVWK